MEYDKRFADRARKRVADAELDSKVWSTQASTACALFISRVFDMHDYDNGTTIRSKTASACCGISTVAQTAK